MATNQVPEGRSAASSPVSPEASPPAEDAVLRDTVGVLTEALKALGKAGKPVEASRLAAQAWSALRDPYPQGAERVNSIMHFLARLPGEESRPAAPTAEAEGREIDVRRIPHNQRHAVIFAAYAAMGPGEGFVLVADHDPRPLRYQFEAQHSGEFTWDYVEEGPQIWRVRIGHAAA